MIKKVINTYFVESEHDSKKSEGLLLWRFEYAISQGYSIPVHDLNCYIALLIKRDGFEKIPEIFKDIAFEDGVLHDAVRFELIRYSILENVDINENDSGFFYNLLKIKVNERKRIIRKEIDCTLLPGKVKNKIGPKNSNDYLELLKLTNEFSDITIIDYFIPIVLKYERLIHIFVRHVEETRFAESSSSKQRTFFSYQSNEIWILLKRLLKQEEQEIKDHFLLNRVNYNLEKKELMKHYWRSEDNPIRFDGDSFVLEIDKNGFIMRFHQI